LPPFPTKRPDKKYAPFCPGSAANIRGPVGRPPRRSQIVEPLCPSAPIGRRQSPFNCRPDSRKAGAAMTPRTRAESDSEGIPADAGQRRRRFGDLSGGPWASRFSIVLSTMRLNTGDR
jgi:hypothetical protein